MLTFIAEKTMELSGKDYSFRIGGDEFLGFLIDPGEDLEKRCLDFKNIIEKEGFHASIGCERAIFPTAEEMPALIRAAEQKMYLDKKVTTNELAATGENPVVRGELCLILKS